MEKTENKTQSGLGLSRRNFLKLAGVGAAIAALPMGTVQAAEKPAHGNRSRNALKAAGSGSRGKADLLILGNVITMDEYKPYAQAVAIKDDKILYVGNTNVAKKLVSNNTIVKDPPHRERGLTLLRKLRKKREVLIYETRWRICT